MTISIPLGLSTGETTPTCTVTIITSVNYKYNIWREREYRNKIGCLRLRAQLTHVLECPIYPTGEVDNLEFQPWTWGGEDVDSFSPVFEQEAFPILQDLEVTARLENVTRFVTVDFAPINLIFLYIHTYFKHQPEQLHALLITLSEQCRLLSQLNVELLHGPGQFKLIPAKQITFYTIRPVVSFLNLIVFEVKHKYPVNITLEEIEELASQWPSLEYLYLNEELLVVHDFTLDLRALVHLACHSPNLLQLGLFMDATAAEILPSHELKPFTVLEVLPAGRSEARDLGAVAALLSCLCPQECELNLYSSWTSDNGRSCRRLDANVQLEIKNRPTTWECVRDLLPHFILVRREKREKSRLLREEVEGLRTRNRLLMNKSNI
ncbi:hypothetical protein AZE42_04050 [Rhizopogon vesiculosus]|uniref:FBD domain-containing protein n=1 Tax=Rhizopogon vesiculosus TaxID=180088 RepID=A0A1J8Q9J5_9AGAM|nr:hypothetical protein AZE42_04050 [Rhizopogon vesiculosus]